jgi:hypothetical protein
MIVGRCKLCGQVRRLCRSHIIPEFCFKNIYDERHRLRTLRAAPNRLYFPKKGYREPLLCPACDGLLNDRYEKSFKTYWFDGHALPDRVRGNQFTIAGFDYTAFKLFHLSILWRAAVSTGKLYEGVTLDPCNEDKLRRMLVTGDAGPVGHYQVFGQVLVDDQGQIMEFMSNVSVSSLKDGTPIYIIAYLGVEWFILLTDCPSLRHQEWTRLAPQHEGTMLMSVEHMMESETIKGFLPQLLGE